MAPARRLPALAFAGALLLGAALLWKALETVPDGPGPAVSEASFPAWSGRQDAILEGVGPGVERAEFGAERTGPAPERVPSAAEPAELQIDAPPTFAVRAVDLLGNRIPSRALVVHLSSNPRVVAEFQQAWRGWEGERARGGANRSLLVRDSKRIPVPEARATLTVATRYGAAWAALDLAPPIAGGAPFAKEVEVRLLATHCIVLRYLRTSGEPAVGVPVGLRGVRGGESSMLYLGETDDRGEASLGSRFSASELRSRFDELRVQSSFTAGPAFVGVVPFAAFERCETVEFTLPPFGRVELLPTLEDLTGVTGVYLEVLRQDPLPLDPPPPSTTFRSGAFSMRLGSLGKPRGYERVPLGLDLEVSVGVNGVGNRDSIEFTGPREEGETVRVDVPLDR